MTPHPLPLPVLSSSSPSPPFPLTVHADRWRLSRRLGSGRGGRLCCRTLRS